MLMRLAMRNIFGEGHSQAVHSLTALNNVGITFLMSDLYERVNVPIFGFAPERM